MSGTLPHWIARTLGVEAAGSGEGTVWSLENSWRWAPWITLVFVAVSLAVFLWAYFHETGSAGRLTRIGLGILRTVLVGLVMLMIAEWVLALKRTGLPYVIVMVDDSGSMGIADQLEDQELRKAITKRLKQAGLTGASRLNLSKMLLLENKAELLRELEDRYKLKLYILSDQEPASSGDLAMWAEQLKKAEAQGDASPLGDRVRAVLNDFRGNPPAAMILLTDGITTQGEMLSDAAIYAGRKGVPLFTIGVSNEQPLKDLKLSDLVADEVVFAGDVLTFEATVSASGFEGKSAKLVLREADKRRELAEINVVLGPDGQSKKVLLPYRVEAASDAEEVEVEYVLELEPMPQETQLENNRQKRRVRVSRKTINVLLVQAYPNYEFRYLKQMLQRDETIALHTVLQDADVEYVQLDKSALPVFPVRREELFKYDVIIFGDVNPGYLSASVMNHISDFVTERGGSIIFIAGPLYTPLAYRNTPLAKLFPAELGSVIVPDPAHPIEEGFVVAPTPLGLSSPALQIGDSVADTQKKWEQLPELYWLLEASSLKPAVRVLAEHPGKTGSDGNKLPIISMQYVGPGKVVFHATDETWRWRYRIGDVLFARYWVQTIRYLSRSKLGKDGAAELTVDRRAYTRGDSVQFRLRFLNEQLAPAEDDGVTIIVDREGSKKQQLMLHRTTAARGVFEGTATSLAEGSYHAWVVQPALDTEAAVNFEVQPPLGELERLQMDVGELKQAARESRGRFYRVTSAGGLLDDLPPGRQVPVESLPPAVLWNKWPVLLLFLVLLTTEWIVRKRVGML